jgi:hypothetical protein
MKRSLQIVLNIIFSIPLFSQNAGWKTVAIDKNFSVQLPDPIKVTDTLGIKVFSAINSSILFQVQLSAAKSFKEDTFRQRKVALDGFVKGYRSSELAKTFKASVSDTSICEIDGRFIRMIDTTYENHYNSIYNYTTLVDGHFISTIAYLSAEPDFNTWNIISKYYQSIEITINKPPLEEMSPADEWNFIVGVFAIMAAIVTILYRRYHK